MMMFRMTVSLLMLRILKYSDKKSFFREEIQKSEKEAFKKLFLRVSFSMWLYKHKHTGI